MAGQGRSSACWSLVALLIVSIAVTVQGADHMVGGTNGWKAPGVANNLTGSYLQMWYMNETFAAGDNLIFTYAKAYHNVLQVDAADYTSCNTSNPMMTYATGNDTVAIKGGMSYFICGTPAHCPAGQKISVNASGGAGPSPGPTSAAFGSAITYLQALGVVSLSAVASLVLW